MPLNVVLWELRLAKQAWYCFFVEITSLVDEGNCWHNIRRFLTLSLWYSVKKLPLSEWMSSLSWWRIPAFGDYVIADCECHSLVNQLPNLLVFHSNDVSAPRKLLKSNERADFRSLGPVTHVLIVLPLDIKQSTKTTKTSVCCCSIIFSSRFSSPYNRIGRILVLQIHSFIASVMSQHPDGGFLRAQNTQQLLLCKSSQRLGILWPCPKSLTAATCLPFHPDRVILNSLYSGAGGCSMGMARVYLDQCAQASCPTRLASGFW